MSRLQKFRLPAAVMVLLLLCITCGACSSTRGNTRLKEVSVQDVSTHVTKGKSTKDDVRVLFGEPGRVEKNSSGETWVYSFEEMEKSPGFYIPLVGPYVGELKYSERVYTFVFNKRGVVTDYSTAEQLESPQKVGL